MDVNLNKFITGILFREIKKLYLSFLYTLEDLKSNDKISDEEFQRYRKRVLDFGNNCQRNIEEQLNSFDFKITDK